MRLVDEKIPVIKLTLKIFILFSRKACTALAKAPEIFMYLYPEPTQVGK